MPKSWIARGAETAERMRRLMQRRGLSPNGFPLWDPSELATLTSDYPDYPAITAKLAGRSLPACYTKAKLLKITKPGNRLWTENELIRLRKIYPRGTRSEILAAFTGRTYGAITKQASDRNIHRLRRPPKTTGVRIIDEVLQRADELNLSRADLDAIGKTRWYFTRSRWTRSKPDHQVIHRVVTFLGGQLRAEWPHPTTGTKS